MVTREKRHRKLLRRQKLSVCFRAVHDRSVRDIPLSHAEQPGFSIGLPISIWIRHECKLIREDTLIDCRI